MKNIFYICTKPIENLEIFTPLENIQESQIHISILTLNEDQNLPNIHAFHVWNLKKEESNVLESSSKKSISYQNFLEQIFLHDLSIVI